MSPHEFLETRVLPLTLAFALGVLAMDIAADLRVANALERARLHRVMDCGDPPGPDDGPVLIAVGG